MRYKQIAQLRPADTTAASLFSPTRGFHYRFKIIVANNTALAVAYRIFHDDDGTTYDATTALAYDVSLAANSSAVFPSDGWLMADGASGNIAVRSATNNALSFTAYGISEKYGGNV